MKKAIFVLISSFLLLAGCTRENYQDLKKVNTDDMHIGYISMDDGLVEFDEIEFIKQGDKARVKELNLSDEDMPNGYYIHNESDETEVFNISKDIKFIFYDAGNLFVDENEDKKYITSDIDEFIEFLYLDSDTPRFTPFWISLDEKGDILEIEEEFVN